MGCAQGINKYVPGMYIGIQCSIFYWFLDLFQSNNRCNRHSDGSVFFNRFNKKLELLGEGSLIKSFCGGPGGGFFKKSPLVAEGICLINFDLFQSQGDVTWYGKYAIIGSPFGY